MEVMLNVKICNLYYDNSYDKVSFIEVRQMKQKEFQPKIKNLPIFKAIENIAVFEWSNCEWSWPPIYGSNWGYYLS